MNLNEIPDAIEHSLYDSTRPWYVLFAWAEARTNVNRFNLFLIGVIATVFVLSTGHGSEFLSNVIGIAYPAYATVAYALDYESSASPPDDPDAVRWFTYWMTFAAMLIAEQTCAVVLQWIPLYSMIKTLFLVWCFLPIENNGAAFLYATVVRPYFGPGPAVDGEDDR